LYYTLMYFIWFKFTY